MTPEDRGLFRLVLISFVLGQATLTCIIAIVVAVLGSFA